MIRVGVTGGIGSGKSRVCALLAERGIHVYDTDSRAHELMNCDPVIKKAVAELFGPAAYEGSTLDRSYIASRVFGDKTMLTMLNNIVHPAVARDFERWTQSHSSSLYVVMECAILFESGFDKFVDKTVTVSAPEDLRIKRVVERDGSDSRQVLERMAHQLTDREREDRADYVIHNSESIESLEVKVDELDKILRS